MAKTLEIYKCNICGIMTEVLNGGDGQMFCCNEPMMNLTEKTADSTTEKHVPVIEKIDGGYKVTVGSTLHPMEEKHYIQWIELLADGKAYRQFLSPGDEPIAEFTVEADAVSARENCNVHGLWKS